MSADPVTDRTAAEAFTRRHGMPPNSRWSTAYPKPLGHDGRPRCRHALYVGQCDNPGKTALADGSTWCGVHDPAAVERRDAVRPWPGHARLAQSEATAYLARAYACMLAALLVIAEGRHDDPGGFAQKVLDDLSKPSADGDEA